MAAAHACFCSSVAWRPRAPRPRTCRTRAAWRAAAARGGDAAGGDDDAVPLFVEGGDRAFDVENVSLSAPLTAAEREAVLRALPRPVARFLIRRADESARPGPDAPGADTAPGAPGGRGTALRAARAAEWAGGALRDPQDDGWYRDYVSESLGEDMDEMGRDRGGVGERDRGEVFAPSADLPLDGVDGVALFAGSPTSPSEQAQQIMYAVLATLLGFVALKVMFAFVQFFVSFTFSFLAIFALSAGIFVFFFLVRF